MTMPTRATAYESAVRDMTQAAAEAELTHAPARLAYWRIAAMDTLLDRLEELRLAGERAPPEDIRDLLGAFAARPGRRKAPRRGAARPPPKASPILVVASAPRHDAELADRVQRINPDDLN